MAVYVCRDRSNRGNETLSTTRAISPNQWQNALGVIEERNGVIELYIADPNNPLEPDAPGLQWKVRLLALEDGRLVVDKPAGKNRVPPQYLSKDCLFHGVIDIDQTRWGFAMRLIGPDQFELNNGVASDCLRFEVPFNIHNAQRRNFYRICTYGIDMEPARLWPLFDLASTVPAQAYARQLWLESNTDEDRLPQPDLGLALEGETLDVSGGGVLQQFDYRLLEYFNGCDLFWLRLRLPEQPASLYMTARLARMCPEPIDGRLLIGLAFTFDQDPPHRHFIEKHLCRFVAELQRNRLRYTS